MPNLNQGTSSSVWALGASQALVLVFLDGLASLPLAAVLLCVRALDRLAVRRRFEERFSVERMARAYPALYGTVLRRDAVGAALVSSFGAHSSNLDGNRPVRSCHGP
jgi:hypothetical protein